MPQDAPGAVWRERMELYLEGGGHLPGASEVVDIRHKVISCEASRQKKSALVRGELELFVYYRFATSDRVLGHGAKVPWHAEVSLPDSVRGPLAAEVVDVRHEQSFYRENEQLDHKIYITFEVWALEPETTLPTQKKLLLGETVPAGTSKRKPATPRQFSTSSTQHEDPVLSDPVDPKIPDWAREAAEEMMRQQQPSSPNTRPWLLDLPDKHQAPELGQAEGMHTRDGQEYEGPAPEWPRGNSFQVLEQALEGEPADERAPTLSPDVATDPDAPVVTDGVPSCSVVGFKVLPGNPTFPETMAASPANQANLPSSNAVFSPKRTQEGEDLGMSQFAPDTDNTSASGHEDKPALEDTCASNAATPENQEATDSAEQSLSETAQATSEPADSAPSEDVQSIITEGVVQNSEIIEVADSGPVIAPPPDVTKVEVPPAVEPVTPETKTQSDAPLVWKPFPKTDLPS